MVISDLIHSVSSISNVLILFWQLAFSAVMHLMIQNKS